MAGVASEDLRKKLLAINPFPRLEDVVARCRSDESATNTEAEFTRRPALAVNVVSVRQSALTSSGRSAPPPTPSSRLQPSTPPATKTVCRFCGGRSHQTRNECPAYGAKCTACNRLHHFADVCESRHNPLHSQSQETVSPYTADVDTCSLATLSLFIKMLDIAISCMCATSPPTVVTPSSNLISQASLCTHSPSTPRSGSKIHIQRAGTSVAPSSGSEHAARIACSCPVDGDAGANAVPFALCRIFQNRRSAVDSDILSFFSLSLSHYFSFSDLIVFRSEGKGR